MHKFLSNGAGEAAAAVAMATVAVATGMEAVMTCPQAAGGVPGSVRWALPGRGVHER